MVIISELVVSNTELVHQSNNIRLKINEKQLNAGTLFISKNSFHWKPNGSVNGISIPWQKVSIHAITSNNPQKSIYLQLDFGLIWPNVYEGPHQNGNGDSNNLDGIDGEDDADDDDDEGNNEGGGGGEDMDEMTEMWFLPDGGNEDEINRIYLAMTECQTNCPDQENNSSSDDEFMEALNEECENDIPENIQNLHLEDDNIDGKYADAD